MKIFNKTFYSLVFVVVISLWLYHNLYYKSNQENSFSLSNYMQNPQKFGNQRFEQFGRIINISNDYFYFDLGGNSIKVFGSGIKKPVLGETVVYVEYGKDGKIRMIDYHDYNYNYFLYAISVIALIIFIVIFLKEWKATWKGFKNA